MFKKSKTKASIHKTTFAAVKKIKIKQKKSLTNKGKAKPQKKQMVVKTPKQKLTQPAGKPAQKRQMMVPDVKQKKTMSDAAISARLRAITGGN